MKNIQKSERKNSEGFLLKSQSQKLKQNSSHGNIMQNGLSLDSPSAEKHKEWLGWIARTESNSSQYFPYHFSSTQRRKTMRTQKDSEEPLNFLGSMAKWPGFQTAKKPEEKEPLSPSTTLFYKEITRPFRDESNIMNPGQKTHQTTTDNFLLTEPPSDIKGKSGNQLKTKNFSIHLKEGMLSPKSKLKKSSIELWSELPKPFNKESFRLAALAQKLKEIHQGNDLDEISWGKKQKEEVSLSLKVLEALSKLDSKFKEEFTIIHEVLKGMIVCQDQEVYKFLFEEISQKKGVRKLTYKDIEKILRKKFLRMKGNFERAMENLEKEQGTKEDFLKEVEKEKKEFLRKTKDEFNQKVMELEYKVGDYFLENRMIQMGMMKPNKGAAIDYIDQFLLNEEQEKKECTKRDIERLIPKVKTLVERNSELDLVTPRVIHQFHTQSSCLVNHSFSLLMFSVVPAALSLNLIIFLLLRGVCDEKMVRKLGRMNEEYQKQHVRICEEKEGFLNKFLKAREEKEALEAEMKEIKEQNEQMLKQTRFFNIKNELTPRPDLSKIYK